MNNFTHLTILRVVRPFDSHVSELASIKTIPSAFVDSFNDAFNLEVLECDWWSWRPEDLKVPLEACSVLRVRILVLGICGNANWHTAVKSGI